MEQWSREKGNRLLFRVIYIYDLFFQEKVVISCFDQIRKCFAFYRGSRKKKNIAFGKMTSRFALVDRITDTFESRDM